MDRQALREGIEKASSESRSPDGALIRMIPAAAAGALAEQLQVPLRQIEREALVQGIVPLRYVRNQKSYTCADQIRLLDSTAAVVGLGGLGGTVLEILARAGVGRLMLIDGDRFEEHNLNRQLLSSEPLLGESKAAAAARRALALHPAIQIESHPLFLKAENAAALLGGCQVALDCLDSIEDRFMLEQAARSASIPLVSAAVAGLTGHVTTILPQDEGLAMIYGPRDSLRSSQGAEKQLGCLPQAVVLIAAQQSSEALKILTGRTGDLLRNRLWVVDLASNIFEVLSLR